MQGEKEQKGWPNEACPVGPAADNHCGRLFSYSPLDSPRTSFVAKRSEAEPTIALEGANSFRGSLSISVAWSSGPECRIRSCVAEW